MWTEHQLSKASSWFASIWHRQTINRRNEQATSMKWASKERERERIRTHVQNQTLQAYVSVTMRQILFLAEAWWVSSYKRKRNFGCQQKYKELSKSVFIIISHLLTNTTFLCQSKLGYCNLWPKWEHYSFWGVEFTHLHRNNIPLSYLQFILVKLAIFVVYIFLSIFRALSAVLIP